MERRDPKRIGASLLREGIISRTQMKEALEIRKKEGGFLGYILVKRGFLPEEELAAHFVEEYGYPYLPLSHYEVNPETIKIIPKEIARKYLILPIDKTGILLTIAHASPLGTEVVEALKELTKCSLTYYISTISEIEKAIDFYYKESKKEGTSPP